jgi:hypothetical protein
MFRLSTLVRFAVLAVVIGLLVHLGSGEDASWAAPDQDVERQTVPTRTPTPKPVTPTVPPPTPKPGPTATSVPTVTPALVTADISTDVYSGPGFEYASVGALEAGDTAPVVGRNAAGTWWQIVFQEGKAWVVDEVVTASPEAFAAPVVNVLALEASEGVTFTLPRAGSDAFSLSSGVLLLVNGALLLLAGRWVIRSRRKGPA